MSPWWRHQMETFSALLAICAGNSSVPGEFPAQRPVTRSFDVFFDLRLNKWLSKQSRGWWSETLSRPLWRHRNGQCRRDIGYCCEFKIWSVFCLSLCIDVLINSSPPSAAYMRRWTGVSIGSGNGLSPVRRKNHYMNQCCLIVNWSLRNKLQWTLNQNKKIHSSLYPIRFF